MRWSVCGTVAEKHGNMSTNIAEAKTYHDGKWIMFELVDNTLFDDMRKLLAIKRKPNKN